MSDASDDPSSSSPPSQDEVPVRRPGARPKKTLAGWVKGLVQKSAQAPDFRSAIHEFIGEHGNFEAASVSAHERRLLSNILKLRNIRADYVMVPRADIVAIDVETGRDDLLALLQEKQFSRYPVYRNTLDDVLGTVHIKDIMARIARGEAIDIKNLLTDIPVASPTMPISDLLLSMQKNKRHMAMIVDEFGGIDGLVTIGDIIESIVGEIEDEHDNGEEPKITQKADGTVVADGRYDIDMFENSYGPLLTEDEREESDTLGGLVCSIAGRVPARGEVLTHHTGIVFEVLDADPRRVNSVRIKNIPPRPS